MLQSIMTNRGQVTIPAEIRSKLNLISGNKLEFVLKGDQIVMMPINRSIKDLKGVLPNPKKSLSCEEMNDVIKNVKG
ncbi:MAG: AbrB/MazE/SpoVT family DNA-binding domain-containing protein [Rickettsiales bacterium]|nr:AbrB/MazE/SpoVT family DNA-binding domain-containing protein [Rickettsiales bacterium]